MLFSYFCAPHGFKNTGQRHNPKDSYTCHQLLEYGNQASTCSYPFVSLNSWHFSFSQSQLRTSLALMITRFTKWHFYSHVLHIVKQVSYPRLSQKEGGGVFWAFCFHNALQLRINTEKSRAESLSVSTAFSSNIT